MSKILFLNDSISKWNGDSQDLLMIVFMLALTLTFLISRKLFFKLLARINKLILPSLYKKDISKLKAYEKVMLGYRYWVTKNAL